MVIGRVTAALVLLPTARGRISAGSGLGAAATGGTAALALSTRQELLVVAVVLSSLYPAIPVLLGITALRERLSRWRTAGLAGAAAAVGLLVAG